MQEKISIVASLEAVSRFTEKLETLFADLPMNNRVEVVLAMQELCVNIVEHAYAGDTGEIHIEIEYIPERVTIIIMDDAENAFSEPPLIKLPDPLSLPESGLGLFIIYHSFDEVEYKRLDSGNRWYLVKRL